MGLSYTADYLRDFCNKHTYLWEHGLDCGFEKSRATETEGMFIGLVGIKNLVSCYVMTVSDLSEQPCNKSDDAIKPTQTQLADTLSTDLLQLVCNLVTTCAFVRV